MEILSFVKIVCNLQPVNEISEQSLSERFEKSFSLIEMSTRGNYSDKNTTFLYSKNLNRFYKLF